jgi:hypothetical protein
VDGVVPTKQSDWVLEFFVLVGHVDINQLTGLLWFMEAWGYCYSGEKIVSDD